MKSRRRKKQNKKSSKRKSKRGSPSYDSGSGEYSDESSSYSESSSSYSESSSYSDASSDSELKGIVLRGAGADFCHGRVQGTPPPEGKPNNAFEID